MELFGDGRDWFLDARFGLFIHWGLYAVPGWHEQHQYRLRVSRREYAGLQQRFDPIRFDPDAWLDLAEAVGMQYITFTAKHIDGFCMWDTAHTDFKVTNSPYGRDVLALLAEACHRRDFPLCVYYAKADMNHPNYPNAGGPYELSRPEPGDEPDLTKYFVYVKEQVRELCTNYGEIHGFWWDVTNVEDPDPSINRMIRQLQPNCVINDRGHGSGDFSTIERDRDPHLSDREGFTRPVEACQSVGVESWGYRRDEDYYADRYLLKSIDRVLAKRGNYLLNVGPDAEGTIREQSVEKLQVVGAWYRKVAESFDKTEAASRLTTNRDVLLTRRGDVVYVHLAPEPMSDRVLLNPIGIPPAKATLLNTGEDVEWRFDFLPSFHMPQVRILRLCNLPVNEHAGTVMVIKLEFQNLPT